MCYLQVRGAAEEYHAEFAAKEATIATLTAEAESARSHMQAEIDKLRSDMEVCLPSKSNNKNSHAPLVLGIWRALRTALPLHSAILMPASQGTF